MKKDNTINGFTRIADNESVSSERKVLSENLVRATCAQRIGGKDGPRVAYSFDVDFKDVTEKEKLLLAVEYAVIRKIQKAFSDAGKDVNAKDFQDRVFSVREMLDAERAPRKIDPVASLQRALSDGKLSSEQIEQLKKLLAS